MRERAARRDVGLEADPCEARRSQWIDKNGMQEVMEEGVDPRERRGSQRSTRTGGRGSNGGGGEAIAIKDGRLHRFLGARGFRGGLLGWFVKLADKRLLSTGLPQITLGSLVSI